MAVPDASPTLLTIYKASTASVAEVSPVPRTSRSAVGVPSPSISTCSASANSISTAEVISKSAVALRSNRPPETIERSALSPRIYSPEPAEPNSSF